MVKRSFFENSSKVAKTGYIRPLLKIKMGARSEHWPVSEDEAKSYTKEALKEKIIATIQVSK
ncbi:hypothetical protein SCG7086_CL_00050 [Chlamydiales bacterium SCGC AG-110-P3]|nr:hypothetical protein SCG7086_CL_00050 [Chlamydiales bacterium SCGC AG-110-P3]